MAALHRLGVHRAELRHPALSVSRLPHPLRSANDQRRRRRHRAEWVKALRCPVCGASSKKIAIGDARHLDEDAAERINGTEESRARHWQTTGERGLSADAIMARLWGWSDQPKAHPHGSG